MAETRAVTVKLDRELVQTAYDLTSLTPLTMRQLFEEALRRALDERIPDGGELAATIQRMRACRESATI